MGIGLSNADWLQAIDATRTEDKKRVAKGFSSKLKAECFSVSGNIKTTPEAEKFIKAHSTKYAESGKALPSTPRGKRRKDRTKN